MARILRPWIGLAIVCAGFSFHPDFARTFWSADYLPNILQQAATNIILAVGMTFVVMTGGIDLSVGSVLALSGIGLGLTVTEGPPPFIAGLMAIPIGAIAAAGARRFCAASIPCSLIGFASAVIASIGIYYGTRGGIRLEAALLGALAVGTGCGLINGMLVAWGRLPAFIATLGMLTAARGLTLYATDGNSVSGLPPRLGGLGEGLPVVAIALAVVLVGGVVLSLTRAGRSVQAIGGNEEASRLSGVDVAGYKILAYAVSGLAAGVAAIVLTAKFRLADTGAGTNAELNAIAAVVIGGASLSGGQGSIVGSLVGALTIAVLNAGLVLTRVPDTLQGVVIGCVIVGTVLLDRLRFRRTSV